MRFIKRHKPVRGLRHCAFWIRSNVRTGVHTGTNTHLRWSYTGWLCAFVPCDADTSRTRCTARRDWYNTFYWSRSVIIDLDSAFPLDRGHRRNLNDTMTIHRRHVRLFNIKPRARRKLLCRPADRDDLCSPKL